MNEPLWKKGLAELWKGLSNLPTESARNTFDVPLADSEQEKPTDYKAMGRWISVVVVVLALAGIGSWLFPLTDANNATIISGIFLKLALFFSGVRLAWPQLSRLFQFKLGLAGVVLLLIAGLIFVIRPRAALYAWPLLVTLAGGLTFLGWLSSFLNAGNVERPAGTKSGGKKKPNAN